MISNSKEILAKVDIDATHNFVFGRVVNALGINVKKQNHHIKAINSQSILVLSMAKDARV